MEIVVKVNELEDIEKLDNADAYLVANKRFSLRYQHSFSLSEIRKIKKYCVRHQKKIYVLVNKIFFDEDLLPLTDFLISLKEMDVDGIYFADLGVFQIAKSLSMEDKCVFFHETFLRNCMDIQAYESLNIPSFVVSKDMSLTTIEKLDSKKISQYGVLAFGYVPLYFSKRQILKNYIELDELNLKYEGKQDFYLKEATRNEYYRVLEQNKISTIFHYEVLNYIESMEKLKQHLSFFVLDSLFFKVEEMQQIIMIFKEGGKLSDIQKITPNIQYSDLFLNKKVGII